jgi:hypothetical protein
MSSEDKRLGWEVASGAAVCLWDKKGGFLEAMFHRGLPNKRYEPFNLECLPNEKLLAYASWYEGIGLWDMEKQSRIHTFTISNFLIRPAFCQTGRFLKTAAGIIDLNPIIFKTNHQPARSVIPLDVLNEWIMWGTQKILWIPSEFQCDDIDTHSNLIALGHSSGQVKFIKLNLEKIPLGECSDPSKAKPSVGRKHSDAFDNEVHWSVGVLPCCVG